MHAASPWAGLAEVTPPPAWKGARRMVELLDRGDDPPEPAKVQRAAADRAPGLVIESAGDCMAILLPQLVPLPERPTRCVPWAQIRPGTLAERELLTRLDARWPAA